MPRRLAVALLLAGCATVERYEVKPGAPPGEVLGAAKEASARLGADVRDTGGEAFELRGVRGLVDHVRVTSPGPGLLELESQGAKGLGTLGGGIAAGTQQLLDDRPAAAPHVTPRSHAAVLALDLVLPFAGGILADAGDPYGASWAERLGMLSSDLAAVGLLLESQLLLHDGFDATFLAAASIGMLVLNRLGAAIFDWRQVSRRNAAVTSGFDLTVLPAPVSRTPSG